MNTEEFDQMFAQSYSDMMQAGDFEGMIELCKGLLLNHNPEPDLRIELMTGVAMAQVGKVNSFVESVKAEGVELRKVFAMTNEEARQIAVNVSICLGLQADGIGKTQTPNGLVDPSEGEQ